MLSTFGGWKSPQVFPQKGYLTLVGFEPMTCGLYHHYPTNWTARSAEVGGCGIIQR